MRLDIHDVVVLGAGTMGAQVAAHLVGQGLDVTLLDIVPKDAEDRSVLARRALLGLRKLKPSPLHLPEHADAIRPGNFEDDWDAVKAADWVFEAVIEDLAVKRQLLARVAEVSKKDAIITTNTSGLGIDAMSEGLPDAFRKRFFGTHFFNPPRYLHLLETIPGTHTDPDVLAAMEAFCDRVLGKGVVRCKDTPNFIGNRVGAYAIGAVVREMVARDMTIEEVDALTGPAIGRPRSATFRTADIAGVDVVARVAANLYEAVPDDPDRQALKLPDFVATMLDKGLLGEKSGGGFYRKDGDTILALDWKTLEYRERSKPKFPAVEALKAVENDAERIPRLLAAGGKPAEFLWAVLSSACLYAAARVPEISDDVVSVDRAMEWGYGWSLGPFRLLDALGPARVAERARAEGRAIPPLLQSLLDSGRETFYVTEDGKETALAPAGAQPVLAPAGVISLAGVKAAGGVVKKNAGATLVDLGEGCALVEFHSKMNALGADAISLLATAAKEAPAHFDALVVGNQGEHFSAGANLMLVLMGAQEEEWDELDLTIRQFQRATMGLRLAPIPVVVAPFGLTLGGGTEVTLHGDRVRASAETYMGLVEVGVGLVPAGGGTKEMARRAFARCADVKDADPFPFLKRAFETIAFAKVGTSGAESRRLYLDEADSLTANPDRLIHDAKQLALGLARAGYRPPRMQRDIPVLGRPALSTFRMAIHNLRRGDQISDHDALIGEKVAAILCGGDRPPGTADEQHFLDLEREAFLSLLGTQKTQQRIAHMLKTSKPLRN